MPLRVVVDVRFARATWPGEDPIGKGVRSPRTGPEWRTVVGVVPDLVQENESPIAWYLPYLQDPVGPSTEQLHLMVRTRTAPVQALQAAILEVDRDLAVYGVGTMEGLWRERSSADRLGAVVSATFAAFGLLLAAFSLYSLLAYSVEMRRTEIGVRIALGASRREILLLVMRQAALRFGVGLALGLVVALGANQLLRGAIADLPWIGWESVAIVTGIMAGVGALAAFLPALKAAGTDPIRTLRG
jgi:ABC-type antimicrobial peptide transport system permease subunit